MTRPHTTDAERREIESFCKRKADRIAKVLVLDYDAQDLETSVGDCIADLMHLCEQRGFDFLEQYAKGRIHFNAELMGGEHG